MEGIEDVATAGVGGDKDAVARGSSNNVGWTFPSW